jgi:hypothetical protein
LLSLKPLLAGVPVGQEGFSQAVLGFVLLNDPD